MSLNGIGRLRPARTQSTAAKCEYCGRYGALGNCESCGAPNEPEPDVEWIEITRFGDTKRTYVQGARVDPFVMIDELGQRQ